MPAKVMGKTKDMVDKNSSRTGVLDGVIANPQGTSTSADQVGGRTAAATDPTKSTASPPPVNTAVNADEKERLAPSLIDYSLAHAAEQQAEGTDSANPSQKSVPVGPATPMVATIDQPKRIQLGGAIVITIPVTTDTIEASETFTTWVTNVKISGSFPGTPGRVILNERLPAQEVPLTCAWESRSSASMPKLSFCSSAIKPEPALRAVTESAPRTRSANPLVATPRRFQCLQPC